MKIVRIVGSTVQEVIPDYALPTAEWYGESFATQCVEAPDEVEQHWTYDAESGTFSPPVSEPEEPEPGPVPGDSLEERVDALETETAAIAAAIERGLRL